MFFSKVPGCLAAAKHGSLGGGGSSPRSHVSASFPDGGDLSPGSGRKSGRGIFHFQGLLLVDSREGELLVGMREDSSRCSSFPDVGEPGDLGRWSSPSTFFVGLSSSREQHEVGAEDTTAWDGTFTSLFSPPSQAVILHSAPVFPSPRLLSGR